MGELSYRVKYGLIPPSYFGSWRTGTIASRKHERLYQFHTRLRDDIAANGFNNPILIWDRDEQIRVPYGRSRARIAVELDIPIPAFIADHRQNPLWDDFESIESIEEALAKFRDPPAVLEFRKDHFHFWGCKQTHLTPEHQSIFDGRQERHNRLRLNRPDVLKQRVAWYYRNINTPSDT